MHGNKFSRTRYTQYDLRDYNRVLWASQESIVKIIIILSKYTIIHMYVNVFELCTIFKLSDNT